MVKIGEYENFHDCAGISYRVEVFSKKNGHLRVYEGVNLVANTIFIGSSMAIAMIPILGIATRTAK
jgi:hypothetical protein